MGLCVRSDRRQGNRETEGGAAAGAAAHLQVPAHHAQQTLADDEPQSGTTQTARCRGVTHLEGAGEMPLHFGADANAAVGNTETHKTRLCRGLSGAARAGVCGAAAVIRIRSFAGYPHIDFATGSELDGIADQVDQHLRQTCSIGHDHRRQCGIHLASQLQPFLVGARRQQIGGFLYQGCQCARLCMQFKPSCFDLRVIQDVVDDCQQRLSGVIHGLCIAALLRAQCGIEQQFGHAQHTIERRADVVAHAGEKLRLGAIGQLVCGGHGTLLFLNAMRVSAASARRTATRRHGRCLRQQRPPPCRCAHAKC